MKSKTTTDRKLMDRLRGSESFGKLLGIVTTTFEMNVDFFETDFLPTLLGLGAWDDRNWSSRVALERHLAELEIVTLLQDAGPYQGRPRSLRIETIPVYLPGMPILHSKVLLAVFEHAVRLIVGSANLTEQGYRKNLESVAVLTTTKQEPIKAHLIRAALSEFESYFSRHLSPASSQLIASALNQLESIASEPSNPSDWVVWSGHGDPLWKKFLDKWPTDEKVSKITIVSPFWSEENSRNGPISSFLTELQNRAIIASGAILHLLSNGEKVGETYLPKIPNSIGLLEFRKYDVAAFAWSVNPNVPKNEIDVAGDFEFIRSLHAKIVIIESEKSSLAYFGSANFTRRGWGFLSGTQRPNIEAGVIVRSIPAVTKNLVPKTIGERHELGADKQPKLASPDNEPESNPWPAFILSMLLAPSGDDKEKLLLRVEVDTSAITGNWQVGIGVDSAFDRIELKNESPGILVGELSEDLLRRILQTQEVIVHWWDCVTGRAFPVNVSCDARHSLPISPASGNPQEQHLIAYYQGKVRWEELFPDPDPSPDDPASNALEKIDENRVDTSRIQSYIVREFVEALQGISDDLKMAAQSTKGCMQLALLGGVSPLALAKHVYEASIRGERTPTATGFQLVEILGCLNSARTFPTKEQSSDHWQHLIEKAVTDIRSLLESLNSRFHRELSPEFRKYQRQLTFFHDTKATK